MKYVISAAVAFFLLVVVIAIHEGMEWEQYVKDNGCEVVESRRVHTLRYDYNMNMYMPSSHIERKYECENDTTHWR